MRFWTRTGGELGLPVRAAPVSTPAGRVGLRHIRLRDARDWSRLRMANETQLIRWEPSFPATWQDRHTPAAWATLHGVLRREMRAGSMLPLVIEVDGKYAGQLTVGNIQRGAVRSGWIGYWVDKSTIGQGVATAAVAMGVDHCFEVLGLHRLEATVQPTNGASQAVLRKVGFREEGLLKRYMDINGAWRDHLIFGLTVEEIQVSAVDALIRSGRAAP